MLTDSVTIVDRTIDNPDTYRWPPRPHWGLPDGVLDPRVRRTRAEVDADRLPYEDVMWVAWAFAGARCARTLWAEMGHRPVTRERLSVSQAQIHNLLRRAHHGAWLPAEAADVWVTLELGSNGRGVGLRIGGIEVVAIQAFYAGWQVASQRLIEDRLS